jgi:hypothetical protein
VDSEKARPILEEWLKKNRPKEIAPILRVNLPNINGELEPVFSVDENGLTRRWWFKQRGQRLFSLAPERVSSAICRYGIGQNEESFLSFLTCKNYPNAVSDLGEPVSKRAVNNGNNLEISWTTERRGVAVSMTSAEARSVFGFVADPDSITTEYSSVYVSGRSEGIEGQLSVAVGRIEETRFFFDEDKGVFVLEITPASIDAKCPEIIKKQVSEELRKTLKSLAERKNEQLVTLMWEFGEFLEQKSQIIKAAVDTKASLSLCGYRSGGDSHFDSDKGWISSPDRYDLQLIIGGQNNGRFLKRPFSAGAHNEGFVIDFSGEIFSSEVSENPEALRRWFLQKPKVSWWQNFFISETVFILFLLIAANAPETFTIKLILTTNQKLLKLLKKIF